MFGGKSLKLIDRIMEAEWREQGVVAVRPKTDRHSRPCIVARRVIKGESKDSTEYPARIIANRRGFHAAWRDPSLSLLAIDEAQFFPRWIIPELAQALDLRRREDFTIAIAGLNLDYARRPFGPMPQLLAMASEIHVWPGVCMKCKGRFGPGLYTQRIRGGTEQRQPGDVGDYEVRCGVCHYIFTE
jgi:thymidine kinase